MQIKRQKVTEQQCEEKYQKLVQKYKDVNYQNKQSGIDSMAWKFLNVWYNIFYLQLTLPEFNIYCPIGVGLELRTDPLRTDSETLVQKKAIMEEEMVCVDNENKTLGDFAMNFVEEMRTCTNPLLPRPLIHLIIIEIE